MKTFGEQLEIIHKHQAKPPVPVITLAKDLGLRVFITNPDEWPPSLSGLIKRDGDSFRIIVNGDHHEHRRRFTIAHEIAHFILHKDKIGDGITDDVLYRSGLSNAVESEANRWAAKILMPDNLVNAEFETGVNDIRDLAKTLNVSPSAMSIRIGVPYEVLTSGT